jgi:hypothetical protein
MSSLQIPLLAQKNTHTKSGTMLKTKKFSFKNCGKCHPEKVLCTHGRRKYGCKTRKAGRCEAKAAKATKK